MKDENQMTLIGRDNFGLPNRTTLRLKVGQRRPCIPDGEYVAMITGIKTDTKFGKRTITLEFEIAQGREVGVKLLCFCNANYESFSEHTKIFQMYLATTGDDLPPGEEMDLNNFYGKLLLVEVTQRKSKKSQNVFSNVGRILKCVGEI